MKIKKPKPLTLITLGTAFLLLLISAICCFRTYNNIKQYSIPYYYLHEDKVLLSDAEDHLNDQQKNVFIRMSENVIDDQEGERNWDNFKVTTLYVEKCAKPGQFLIITTTKPTFTKLFRLSFKTQATVKLYGSDSRHYSYRTLNYKSDFSKYKH